MRSSVVVAIAFTAAVAACGRQTRTGQGQKCSSSSSCPANELCTAGLCTVSASPVITTDTLAHAKVGAAYSAQLEAHGGTPPFKLSLLTGSGLPAGLTLAASGAISGTPTQAGSAAVGFKVTDSAGKTGQKTLTVTVDPPSGTALAVTTTSLASGQVGQAYSATLAATGGATPYVWSLASGSLPAGLTLSGAGDLAGAPTAAGTASFTVQVTDASSPKQVATANLSITVQPSSGSALAITTTALPDGVVGAAYSQALAATGGATPYAWSLAAGTSLPSGLTLSAAGVISGTPSQAGSTTFTVQASDASSPAQVATAQLSIAVTATAGGPTPLAIVTSALPGGQVGVAYTASVVATGGTTPYAFSVATGALPAGLSLAADGTISGTPVSPGASSFTLQATDASTPAQVATRTFSLAVLAGPAQNPLQLTTTTLPAAAVGAAYSAQLTASGGATPYSFSLSAGSTLPPGLTLASTGLISGTPTTAGRFSFTAVVVDSSSPQQSASAALTLDVTSTTGSLVITTTNLPNAVVGVAYNQQLAATGGTAPYAWAVATGSLPAGLSLSASGAISGTPTLAGSFAFTVEAQDGSSPVQIAQASFTLTVNANPANGVMIVTSSLPPATVGRAYSFQLAAAGGTAPYAWSTAGALPAGLTLSAGGLLSGTPTAAGSYTFTVDVADSAGATASRQLTLTVLSNPGSSLSVVTATLPGGAVNAPYNGHLAAAGGTLPYAWSLGGGALPGGLSLSTAGDITGTPAAAGTFDFTVTVSDSGGATASKALSITVR